MEELIFSQRIESSETTSIKEGNDNIKRCALPMYNPKKPNENNLHMKFLCSSMPFRITINAYYFTFTIFFVLFLFKLLYEFLEL